MTEGTTGRGLAESIEGEGTTGRGLAESMEGEGREAASHFAAQRDQRRRGSGKLEELKCSCCQSFTRGPL